MSDDYLWDGSGDADPEIEHLERLLKNYRYQPRPLELPAQPPRMVSQTFSPRLAAAAALILTAVAALGFFLLRQQSVSAPPVQVAGKDKMAEEPAPTKSPIPDANASLEAPKATGAGAGQLAASQKPKKPAATEKKIERGLARESGWDRAASFDPGANLYEPGEGTPASMAFVSDETARHIESAQMVLRSFRNVEPSDSGANAEIAYEREKSRGLLSENMLLRRDAEARGNLPVEELLSSLEPLLLDIANLPDRPSQEDVRSIKERIEKKEIVATLQVYSAQNLTASYR